jgi:16S rRNA U1498 N3-methylase RsmE
MVDIRSSRLTTVITIRNWDKYQGGGQQKGQQKDNRTDTIKNDKKVEKLIALSTVLIAAVKSESSLDSIIEKYKAELGVDRLREILAGCVKRNLNFDHENRLAAYLQTCLRQNGHSKVTSGLKDLKGDEIGYI